VQHWNWAHHQSNAEWLKPLFVGDWLEPNCIATCRSMIEAHPGIEFLLFYFFYHRGEVVEKFDCHQMRGMLHAKDATRQSLCYGNFFGGPINTIYQRAAYEAVGGHYTGLPLTADFDLYFRLATESATYIIPEYLGNFVLHDARFAKKGSGTRRRESMAYEMILTVLMWIYARRSVGGQIPQKDLIPRLMRLFWDGSKDYFWRLAGDFRRLLIRQT
jgi:hypothetical protein